MVVEKNLSQLLGSFVNVINSGLNFGIYIFLPLLIGINSYTSFQIDNVMPILVILLFSPSLPFIIINKKKAFCTFLILIFTLGTVLFFISSKLLVIANILWLFYGFFAMNLYYDNQKNSFYFYTIFLTILQLISLFFFKDYFNSYLFTSIVSFLLILIFERYSIFTFFKNLDYKFSLTVFYSLLRPIFSISFFWQVSLFIASKYNSKDFLSVTYYSKISLSVAVAVFAISSMDIIKEKRINKSNLIYLSLFSVVIVNFLIIILDYFGKNNLNISKIYATIFLLLSIMPSILFNIVCDIKIYRLVLVAILGLLIILIFLGFNLLLIIGLGLLLLTLISYYSYIKVKCQHII